MLTDPASHNDYASLDDLTQGPSVREDDMETLRGAKVRVRGLTRTQVLELRKLIDKPDYEPALLAFGLARPTISRAHAKVWEDSAPAGEIEAIADKIFDLSGMGDDAGKAAYKSVRVEPGA